MIDSKSTGPLTIEEASHYFTIKELDIDLNKKENWSHVRGFYNIPSVNPPRGEEGWDDVIYVSKRRRKTYYEGTGNYYVYALSNPSIPDILKIGFTGKHPEKRAQEISRSTGVPTPYKVEYAFKCHDGHNLEKEVHKELDYCRVSSDREHFRISLVEAKESITRIGQRYTSNG